MKTAQRRRDAAPVDFELTTLLGFLIFRLSSSLGSLAERNAQEVAGLTLPEYRCLVILATRGSMGVTPLCHALHIDKAWVSRTLAKLVRAGLVGSVPDPADARRTIFSITPKGRQTSEALIARAMERQSRVLDGFSGADVEQLLALLRRMQENADRLKQDEAPGRR
ncbi:MarR family winged helix-turn-helix transcriptional regulator [Pigmentiphaga sp. NML080357]|uniref:MarR family winged helix-turn-helix transcriptional regulator n=1 Tax=Pigmentiphaga sp. NML080357 TaxID=2008675 RepID=UPI0013032E00|nr:MarR family winged helix-turn-helix transcriptional regulator [Pigmentiphaga sp. NML080357]